MMRLEQRVQRLEDRLSINDLVVGYFLAADGDDLERVGGSFTENATFSASGQLCARGRERIVEFIRDARTHMGLTLHTPHYSQATFRSDDEASGLIGAHLELVLEGTSHYGAVRYVDEYVRDGAIWRICSRDMRTIYIAPWLDAGRALASNTPVRWPGTALSVSDYARKLGTRL